MPWIKQENCSGCAVCVEECPAEAIAVSNDTADIDMEKCIHCGTCHDICPQEAVRHDSEKTPEDVNNNVKTTKEFMDACEKYFNDRSEKYKCLNRMLKHFNRQKLVAEKTIAKLEKIKSSIELK
jgi:ferredoxin